MSFTFENQIHGSLSDFSDGYESRLRASNLEFAHPVDGVIIRILDTVSIKNIFSEAVNMLVSAQQGLLLSTGIPINQQNFPELYDILLETCETLSIDAPHTIVTSEISGVNAFATGTDDFSFIAISSFMPKFFSASEQKFILAHECGHVAMGHMVYHTAVSMISSFGQLIPIIGPLTANTISLPLNTWSRCSEITADRAGLLCCRDLRTAQMALLKLIGGFTDISDIDVDLYIKQSESAVSSHGIGKYAELFRQHPLIFKRLKALKLFHNSELYHRITAEAAGNKKLLSDAELNKRIAAIIKIL